MPACGSDSEQAPGGSGGSGEVDGSTPDSGGAGSGGTGVPSTCGNFRVDGPEQCDDGNADETDGCTSSCTFTCEIDAQCSDSVLCNGEEICSPQHRCGPGTPAADGERCGFSYQCLDGVCVSTACGDGEVIAPEECDDADTDPDNGCDACRFTCVSTDSTRDCTAADACAGPSLCSDGSHTCSARTPLADYTPCSGGVCIDGVCHTEYCGDGKVQTGEECDDGNRTPADGCEPTCRYTCVPTDPTRNCPAANSCQNNGTCNTTTHTCSPPNKKANGVSCGTGMNCIEGNCLPIRCLDGVAAQGVEECDDGNNRDADGCGNDCTFSCKSPQTDCPAPPDCRYYICLAYVCRTLADPSQESQSCDTGAGSATCVSGACTTGQCGDGVVQTGEECDFGKDVNGVSQNKYGSGCEPTCITSCQTDAECDDGDPCNGVESCGTVTVGGLTGKRCTAATPRPDGTACGSGKVCVKGSCRTSFCGDGVTDTSNSEECDPPNTAVCDAQCRAIVRCDLSGTWATNLGVNVDVSGPAIESASGVARLWASLQLQQSALDLTGGWRPCGFSVPDLTTIPAAGSEVYGPIFPDSLFDSPLIPSAPFTGSLSSLAPGGTLSSASSSILLGLSLDDPFGAWPTLADLQAGTGGQIVDHDNDGKPGVTLLSKTGPLPDATGYYTYTIVNVSDPQNLGRADRLYVVLRVILAVNATLVSCDEMSGTVSVSSIDLHVVGCRRVETGADCTESETQLVDATRPIFAPKGGTMTAKRVSNSATCADVRAAVP